jgi:hypothetical protein
MNGLALNGKIPVRSCGHCVGACIFRRFSLNFSKIEL